MNHQSKQGRRTLLFAPTLCGAALFLFAAAPHSIAQPDLKPGMGAEKEKQARKQAENEAMRAEKVLRLETLKMGRGNAFNEQRLQAELQAQGVTDEATLKAIFEHMERVDKARDTLDKKSDELRANLKPNTVVADAQINVLINDYQAATEDYKMAREKSAKQLDEKINYSKRARLHAVLLTLGIVGDGPQQGNTNRNGGFEVFERLNAAGGPLIMRWNGADGGNGVLNFQGNFQGDPADVFAAPGFPGGFPNADIIANNALRAVQPPPLAMGANPGFGAPGQAFGRPLGQPFTTFNADKAQMEAMKADMEALKARVNEMNEELKQWKAAQEKSQKKTLEKND